jgi:hypothetical protein
MEFSFDISILFSPIRAVKNLPTQLPVAKGSVNDMLSKWLPKAFSVLLGYLHNAKLWYTTGKAQEQAIVLVKKSLVQYYAPRGKLNAQTLGEVRFFRKHLQNRPYSQKELYNLLRRTLDEAEPAYDITFTDIFHGLIYKNICRRILPEVPEITELPLTTVYDTIEFQLDFFTILLQNIYYLIGLMAAQHYKFNTNFGRETIIQRNPSKKNTQNYLESFVILWIHSAKLFHAIVEGTPNDISRCLFNFQTWCISLNLYDDVSVYKHCREYQRLYICLVNTVMACWQAFLRLPSKDIQHGVAYILHCGFDIDEYNIYVAQQGYRMEPIFPRVMVDFALTAVKPKICHEIVVVGLTICTSVAKLKLALMNNNTWKLFTEYPSFPDVPWFQNVQEIRDQYAESRALFRKNEKAVQEDEIEKILKSL